MNDIELMHVNAFLAGQLELYKIELNETQNNNYIEVMHDLNKAIKVFRNLQDIIKRLHMENVELKNTIKSNLSNA